jgi:branched-chain amino acid transport system permease protein
MASALGVNQARLYTGVFFLGSFLAGLGGAIQLPKGGADLLMDMNVIAAAFVVVVVGGMGNIIGAYLAAVLIGELSAFGILMIPQSTLVMMFLVMAVVLVIRPYGLFGKPEALDAGSGDVTPALLQPASKKIRILGLLLLTAIVLLPLYAGTFQLILMTEIAIFALAAMSLYFISPDGPPPSDTDGARPGYGAFVGRAVGPYHRLVLRAIVRCLPRHAHPGLCPDMLVDCFSVGWLHRR